MAKKSNKTEHVMKLITKDKAEDDLLDFEDDEAAESASNAGAASGAGNAASEAAAPEVGVKAASGGHELNYRTRLKIEIEPEIELKEPVRARQSRAKVRSVKAAAAPEDDEEVFAPGEDEGALDEEYADDGGAEDLTPPPKAKKAAAIPDGVPYENQDDPELEMNEQYASIKRDEERRTRKIRIESALLSRSKNLVNLSEIMTKELMPSVMEKLDVCTCPVCASNVLALTLNSLPTKYVTTDVGKQYMQLETYKKQNELDIMAALTKACMRVKQAPRHHEIIDDLDE
jgi:competence protein ComFB